MIPLDIPPPTAEGLGALLAADLMMALVLGVIGGASASGQLERNGMAGIRIPSTMSSPEAWAAGHRAGARWLVISAVVAGLAGLAGLIAWVAGAIGTGFVFAWAGLIAPLLLLIPAVVAAHRGARSTRR